MSKQEGLRFRDDQERIRRRYKDILSDSTITGHLWLRDMLRRAWDTPDTRAREWLCFRFRDAYALMVRRADMEPEDIRREDVAADVDGARYDPPPVSPIEAALFHFQHAANRALRCPNVDCPAPYFFATKKGQKFCSSACALTIQRESKRVWWEKNRSKVAERKTSKRKRP